MANSITAWMGDGLQGAPGGCEGSYDNPVISFGEPFGHAHVDDLIQLLENCTTCSIYGAKTSFNVSSLSTCHEVVFNYWRAVGDIDGRTYEIHYRVEKGGEETNYMTTQFVWDDAYTYVHGYNFFGWTPCFMWPGGSDYYPNYVEIFDNGTDYESFIELWDTVTNTKVAEWSQTFTITGLTHTIMSGTIQNYAGENVKGDIRIRAEYTLPAGACADGIGRTGEVYYQRATDDDYSYNINVDGMEGLIRITPYKCGYVKKEIEFSGITAKSLNTDNNFTSSDYLPTTIQGRVVDSTSNGVANANVYTASGNYGAKTNSTGYYALPVCETGNYTPYAIKNNFNRQNGVPVSQTGHHPTSATTRNLTIHRQSEASGGYAHKNKLTVFDQSVIIPDDPVTGAGTLIKASTVGTTTVKAKTRKWGTAAALGTSTGPGTSYQQNGSGGYNAGGDTGDAEDWE